MCKRWGKRSPALTKITREIKYIKNIREQVTVIFIWKIEFSRPGERFIPRELSAMIWTCCHFSRDSSNSKVFIDVWLSLDKSVNEFSMVSKN